MELNGGGRIQLHDDRPTEAIIIEPSSSSPLAPPLEEESMWQQSFEEGENMDSEPYPERPGEKDCVFYLKTGRCRFGDACRYNHPPDRKLAVERMNGAYPERIGQPECQYYLKTGSCKFGPTCKFHHPKDNAGITGRVQFNVLGYPLRPNEKECAYYLRTGQCKFSNTCKFNHPEPSNSMLLLHSLTTSGQQSYAGGLTSFIASPNWQGHSGYAQLILSQGLVQVPSWNTFPEILGSASSPESQQQNSGNDQFVGMSHQSGTTMGSSASLSSVRFGSFLMEQHGLQRASIFPERPGKPECQFYKKTGDCKFGAACRFHHPRERMIPTPDCMLSPVGLPLRPGEAVCIFYHRYGLCKYGPACKYDHPIAAPKGIVTNSPSTSSSPDVPVVQQLLGSSSGPPALTLSSENSPVSGFGKFRSLSLSNSPQMNSDEENVESE